MKNYTKAFTSISLFVFAFLATVSCIKKGADATNAEALEKDMGVQWNDPVGDVDTQNNIPQPDLVSVKAEGREGFIHLTVNIDGGLSSILAYTDKKGKKYGASLVTLFIDIDNDESTGGSSLWIAGPGGPLAGYEYEIVVVAGFEFVDKKSGAKNWVAGSVILDTNKVDVTGYRVNGMVKRYDDNGDTKTIWSKPDGSFVNWSELTEITGESVIIRIPYDLLSLKGGDTVRLCFQDHEPMQGIFSVQKTLVLG